MFHTIPDAPPLNVVVNGNILIQTLGFPGSIGPDSDGLATRDIVVGIYTIEITLADGTVVLDLGELTLGEGRNYFIAATGLANNPLYLVEGTEP